VRNHQDMENGERALRGSHLGIPAGRCKPASRRHVSYRRPISANFL
jgi:hypothetical protein